LPLIRGFSEADKEKIKKDINILQEAASEESFYKYWELMKSEYDDNFQKEFEEKYIYSEINCWYNGKLYPGLCRTNNPIETMNKKLKQEIPKKLSFKEYLNTVNSSSFPN